EGLICGGHRDRAIERDFDRQGCLEDGQLRQKDEDWRSWRDAMEVAVDEDPTASVDCDAAEDLPRPDLGDSLCRSVYDRHRSRLAARVDLVDRDVDPAIEGKVTRAAFERIALA